MFCDKVIPIKTKQAFRFSWQNYWIYKKRFFFFLLKWVTHTQLVHMKILDLFSNHKLFTKSKSNQSKIEIDNCSVLEMVVRFMEDSNTSYYLLKKSLLNGWINVWILYEYAYIQIQTQIYIPFTLTAVVQFLCATVITNGSQGITQQFCGVRQWIDGCVHSRRQ